MSFRLSSLCGTKAFFLINRSRCKWGDFYVTINGGKSNGKPTKDMVEIRWHGRGGQGAKMACLLLADVAGLEGKFVQGFPEYGPERMGAPITAYNRISEKRCTIHSNIYYPDYVVVVDESLLDSIDVTGGLKEDGAIIINTPSSPQEMRLEIKGWERESLYHRCPPHFGREFWAKTFPIPLCWRCG
jgi:2-oxoacid:acceptor oxidoreductase gamma subunit (pyruvate/2-ketoisovalerate family)